MNGPDVEWHPLPVKRGRVGHYWPGDLLSWRWSCDRCSTFGEAPKRSAALRHLRDHAASTRCRLPRGEA